MSNTPNLSANKTSTQIEPVSRTTKKKEDSIDVDKMMYRKVDLDYIPGLDDDLKVILPGFGKEIKNFIFLKIHLFFY